MQVKYKITYKVLKHYHTSLQDNFHNPKKVSFQGKKFVYLRIILRF